MFQNYIIQEVAKLVKTSGSRDPFEICDFIGVNVKFVDLGNLKGMYNYVKRNRFAIINNNLDEYMQKLVCAHELGHDKLHRHLAKNQCLQEFMLYDMKSRPEYEANVFASELLIPDNDILDLIYDGYDMEQIARELYTDINLVAIKMGSMNTRGYGLNVGYSHRSDFLGR